MITVELVGNRPTDRSLVFWCPGCKEHHPVCVASADSARPVWAWNGDRDHPTFHPSLLIRGGFVDGQPTTVCHSFITNGWIQFLGDCTHPLAGQTVRLPECEW